MGDDENVGGVFGVVESVTMKVPFDDLWMRVVTGDEVSLRPSHCLRKALLEPNALLSFAQWIAHWTGTDGLELWDIQRFVIHN